MKKTINIGEKEVILDNNFGWLLIYREQFGHDILPTLMPLLASFLNLAAGVLQETGKSDSIDVKDVLAIADGESMTAALIHMSGFELTELINIVWCLAKNADEDIPEPRKWIKDFDTFPLDTLVPEVFKLVLEGSASSKNLERIQKAFSGLNPKTKKKQSK